MSPSTIPPYVIVQFAVAFPSYVLLLQLGVLAVNAFALIVIVLLPQSLSLWLESPSTIKYTVVVPTLVLVGFSVVQLDPSPLVAVRYFNVPPECPAMVTVCASLSYVPVYAVNVLGHVASLFTIVNVPLLYTIS